jgi:hypothetical protein
MDMVYVCFAYKYSKEVKNTSNFLEIHSVNSLREKIQIGG